MRPRIQQAKLILSILLLLLTIPASLKAELYYALTSGGGILILGFVPNSTETDLVIPAIIENRPVTSIARSAFQREMRIRSVTIPDTVISIGDYAFEQCFAITNITFGKSVVSIGEGAFRSCWGVKVVIIPDSVTSIGAAAFVDCTALSSVYFMGDAPKMVDSPIGGGTKLCVIFDKVGWGSTLFGSSITEWFPPVITSSPVTSARAGVTFAYNITAKEGPGTQYFASGLPEGLTLNPLTGIISGITTTPGTFPIILSARNIRGTQSLHLTLTVNISLLYTIVNNTVTITGRDPQATGHLVIPDTIEELPVTMINRGSFMYCDGLTSVTIPNGVTSIGESAFAYCTQLKSATIGNSVTSIGDGAFRDCLRLTSITIPNGVTSMGDYPFYNCYGLTSVTIGNGIPSIGRGAFQYCTGLTRVLIPSSVNSIGHDSFFGCTGLTNVTIGRNVTYIGRDVFGGGAKLNSCFFMGDAPYFDERAFPYFSTVLYYIEGKSGWNPGVRGNISAPFIPPHTVQALYDMARNQIVFSVNDAGDTAYPVEYTEDFKQWIPLANKLTGTQDLSQLDPQAVTRPHRFYRVVSQ